MGSAVTRRLTVLLPKFAVIVVTYTSVTCLLLPINILCAMTDDVC